LICQDLARGYQRKYISPRRLLKIDLQKAFDSIHWDFIHEMLLALKFPIIFTKWIMACLTSIHFKIRALSKAERPQTRRPTIPSTVCDFHGISFQTHVKS